VRDNKYFTRNDNIEFSCEDMTEGGIMSPNTHG